MKQPCPHCDQRNVSLLRLVLLGELLCADETQLLALANVMEQCGLLQLAASRTPAPVKPGTCAGRKRSFSRLLSSSTARRSCRMRHCSSLRPLRAQDDSSPCLRPLTLVGRQWKNSAQVLTDSYQVGVRLCRYTVPHD